MISKASVPGDFITAKVDSGNHWNRSIFCIYSNTERLRQRLQRHRGGLNLTAEGKEAVEMAERELAGFNLGCTCPLDQQGAQLLRCLVLHCGVAGRYGSPANDGKGGGCSD